jgi:beta-glucosidase
MRNVPAIIVLLTLSSALAASAQETGKTIKNTVPQLGKDPISAVVNAMTLEEKAKMVVGMGMKIPGLKLPGGDPESEAMPMKVPGAAGRTHPIPRLGIPSVTVTDGPAGIRIEPIRDGDSSKTYYATAFPVATLLASTWDTALLRQVGIAFGNEVHEYGSDVILGPALNIHRNPLGGRNFEYYSEDPLIAGEMTAAMVKGLQSQGVGTSIKHFAANNQETDRNSVNTIASERALREIYLKGFEIAIKKSNPTTVMSSYNLINGTYTSQRKDLLDTVLRKEWGFKGTVMTDWFGGDDPVAQMAAGNDLVMPGSPDNSKKILDAVNSGSLPMADLDRNVARILRLVTLSPEFKKYKYSNHPDLQAHAKLVRKAAAEGMVLLRNEAGTLPLASGKKVALLGNNSYELIAGGTGSGDVNKAYSVSLAQGLKNAGYTIDADLDNSYDKYMEADRAKRPKGFMALMNPAPPAAQMDVSDTKVDQLAGWADIAVYTVGRNAGEGKDRKLENDYYLSDAEKNMIHKLSASFHAQNKKLVVVLNIGGVIDVASWRDDADAILLAWQPGLEGGNSMVDVLSGKVNPSGRLATTFPMEYKDVPSSKNFPGKEFPEKATKGMFGMKMTPAEVTYEEGIYVGYRYYNTFGVKPAYPFGYGLSYTKFDYSSIRIDGPSANGTVTGSIDITNTGTVAGEEVVQIYVSAPHQHLDKPAEELRAFTKTRTLRPGEKETIRFTLRPADLASYDTPSSSWVAEEGMYTIKSGPSSEEITTMKTFTLPKTLVVEKDHRVLTPATSINELHASR